MMGGQSSKKKGDDTPPTRQSSEKKGDNTPPIQLKVNAGYRYAADLSSYEEACIIDPELQSIDASIHGRTSRVINSLVTGAEVQALSFDSLREVTECLLDMNQDIVKVILECKKDIWKNDELFSLVEDYFESSIQTLDFCTALGNCLKRARNSQVIIQLAVKQFEEEVGLQDGVLETRFTKTLEDLNKFKEAGNPFTDEFFKLFQSVYVQQVKMLGKLQAQKRKLDKKLKSLGTWRKVTNVLFVAAFVSVLIFSVVAAAVAAPPVVTALAGALTVPIGTMGKWCNYLWRRYEKEVQRQKELLNSLYLGTYITVKDMDNIRLLVNKLEIEIESMLQKAEFANREDAVRLAIDEIKKKLDVFMETIEDLGRHADKCSRGIRRARTVILQRIIRHRTQSTADEDSVVML